MASIQSQIVIDGSTSDQEENGACSPIASSTVAATGAASDGEASPSRLPDDDLSTTQIQPAQQQQIRLNHGGADGSEEEVEQEATEMTQNEVEDHNHNNSSSNNNNNNVMLAVEQTEHLLHLKETATENNNNNNNTDCNNKSLSPTPIAEPLRHSVVGEEQPPDDIDMCEQKAPDCKESATPPIESLSSEPTKSEIALPPSMAQFGAGPVTLEAIQNMQMAIAQFAAKTIANGSSGADNEAAMKQLAFLQQTLFNLQQQQLFQIQLIQQLQSQLAMRQASKCGEEGEDLEEEREDGEEDTYEEEERIAEMELRQKAEARMAEAKARQHLINAGVRLNEEEMSGCSTSDSLKRKRESCDDVEEAGSQRRSMEDTKSALAASTEKCGLNSLSQLKALENMPLPFGNDLASSIITNHDDLPEPNSLEMLQKRAQEVLDSASQGILANNMADEYAFKDKNGESKNRNEPFFKHRCRYCGKVFGSDSALQIHIRSHTGERPFKCNVCGSRFTTKGNLKVHFQRHAHKFPHISMNATPIPEHLDKFHPPLLDQMSPDSSPTHTPAAPMSQKLPQPTQPMPPSTLPMSFPASPAFPGLSGLYRPPMDLLKSLGAAAGNVNFPNPFFPQLPGLSDGSAVAAAAVQAQAAAQAALKNSNQDMPTDLRKTSASSSPNLPVKSEVFENTEIKEQEVKAGTPSAKEEKDTSDSTSLGIKVKEEHIDMEDETESASTAPTATHNDATSMSLDTSARPDESSTPPSRSQPLPMPPVVQPAQPPPANLMHAHSPRSPGALNHLDHLPMSGQLPPALHTREDYFNERFPLNFTKTLSPEHLSPIRSPAHVPRSPFFNPIKHEMALLPRPHSNDNSWENFIEVSNTSETLKLKELMKNKKLTDPNQCVVCDRVLSCKSALQMHYRTHTGERPFKCRICGRAFTTKGNLKTHMAVHKIRPPMRNFHQCPVCHKKYSNALVLQQHIRLHTGEPTDLTPEQIQAAEIRDPPPSMMPGAAFMNPFAAAAFHFGAMPGAGGPMGGPQHNGGHLGSESSQGDMDDNMDCGEDFDDDVSSHSGRELDVNERSKSGEDFKALLFEQKLRIDSAGLVNSVPRPRSAASNANSANSAPTSPNSVQKNCASSPARSDASQGALDLTPRGAPSTTSQNSHQSARSPLALSRKSPTPPGVRTKSPNTPLHVKSLPLSPASTLPPSLDASFPHASLHHHLQQQHQQLIQQQVAAAAHAQAQAHHHHQQLQQHAAAMHQEQMRREQQQQQQQSQAHSPHLPHHLQQLSPPQQQGSTTGPPTAPAVSVAPGHQPPNPLVSARPPFGMFPNLPLFPPATAQNMCSAMNTIAQSVMPAAPFNPLALTGEL